MKLKFIIFSLLSLICPGLALAHQPQIFKTVLDNGLTVLIQEVPSSEVISIDACVKTGSAVEDRYLGTGISHFIEHMLFKGTSKRPVGAIAREVQSLGGTINASTSHDYTIYTLDLPQGFLSQGLDIISDMLTNSSFDADQMQKERKVIHGEMRLYRDRPHRFLSDLVFRHVYIRHPYQHPMIGYPMLFDSITHDELYGYYQERYIPNNMVLSVAGPLKADEILPLIKAAFKDFKSRPFVQRHLPAEPPQLFGRYEEVYYPTPLMHFSLAYQGVSVSDPDLYALDVLSMALGQGESSRLYKDVYKTKHWVESISASNFTPQDQGFFEIEGVMSKDHLPEVLASLKATIDDIQKRGLSAVELEKTKRQVSAQFIFGNQTAPSLAYRAATDEAMTADANFSRHYVEQVKQVTNQDIQRVANRYLQDSHLSVTVLKPKAMAPAPSVQPPAAAPEKIKKVVLDNGLTILLHEDHSVAVVAVKLLMYGGTRQEDPARGGIAHLTADVWTKGTGRMSEEQIAQAMEQRGGSLDSSSGHNTMTVSMDVLSDDLLFALDLLEDVVKNPSMPPEAIDRQRQAMLTAMQERDDDIMDASSRALLETLYLKHPLRLDPLGTKESLSKMTRGDIIDFYHRLMYGNNMVIAVFGDCDSPKVLQDLKKKFGSLKKGQVQVKLFSEPPPEKTRFKDLRMDKEQALLMMAFRAPAFRDPDRFGMEVLDTILGASLSGRLFVKIRDQLGQAYTISSSYSPDLDTGTFTLYVLTKPDKIDSVKGIIIQELEDLRTRDVSAEELQSAKNYLKGTFKGELLTNSALASMSSLDELYGLGYNFYRQFDGDVDQITVQDVRRMANQYLDISKAAVVITKPKTADTNTHE
ncbi:MAG: insulinase family protein [Candidatus Omnitrophica bacterium]|nr:insulinase family protein [Candidatus Omnitrophota bacterium]